MFNAVKVFSATVASARNTLGEQITTWMRENNVTPVEAILCQSSDAAFHCITLVVFYQR